MTNSKEEVWEKILFGGERQRSTVGSEKYLVDITSEVSPDGSFSLDRQQLEKIHRDRPLEDGAYTLNLIATDKGGNTSEIFTVYFVLDTVAPSIQLDNLKDEDAIDDNSLLAGTVDEDLVMVTYR